MNLTTFKLGIPVTLTGDQAAEIESEITQLRERNAELDNESGSLLVAYNQAMSRVKELEKSVLEEIENRDNREEWLDALSDEVARYFGVDIGEHSSANNPWDEAIKPTISRDAKEQLEFYAQYRADKYGDHAMKSDLSDYIAEHEVVEP